MSDPFELAKLRFLQGVEAMQRLDYASAEQNFRSSLAYLPDRVSTLVNLQAVLVKRGNATEALEFGRQIHILEPQSAEAWLNDGNAYNDLGDLASALACYGRSIAIDPNNQDAWNNRGILNLQQRHFEDAYVDFKAALACQPNNPDTLNNLGALYKERRHFEQAVECFHQSMAINPGNPNVYNNLGNLYLETHDYEAAGSAFKHGLSLDQSNPDLHYNLGNLYAELKQYGLALQAYQQAYQTNPSIHWLAGRRLSTRTRLCQWDGFESDRDWILESIKAGKPVCLPFDVMCLSDSCVILQRCAEIYSRETLPPLKASPQSAEHGGRLRIGYLSCDFRDHAVSYLISGVLAAHDHLNFEISCFDIGGNDNSPTRQRLIDGVEHFYEVSTLSDEAVAAFITSRSIDILVDLTGHTRGARTAILALRPAPIQVNYLGYPGTMGMQGLMDYIIADRTLIKTNTEQAYSEKIIYLPDCFQANDAGRRISDIQSRAFYGLPEQGFVFACFAHASKVNPQLFDIWLSILSRVPKSVLWLYSEHAEQEKRLQNYAVNRGVAADRLFFVGVAAYADHLARYGVVDLVLDTFPFNGGTTSSDALWAGAPVLTLCGDVFSSRMSTSLLMAVGLPELVCDSLQVYEEQAVALATNPEMLVAMKEKLFTKRTESALFDTQRFTKNLELAYKTIWERYQTDLPIDHVYV